MADAYVYDAIRTPRGRGKKDGSLHEVPAVRLGAHVLEAVRDRNGLDTGTVDDIIFGCVDPVGEAGSVIPRSSAFEAGYATSAPGMPTFDSPVRNTDWPVANAARPAVQLCSP